MGESFQKRYKQVKRQDAENIITEYLKPVFGFALKRCKTTHDAEDLSQEIILRAFRALLCKDDIESYDKFIWTVAHNALSNYYRESARSIIGVPIDEAADVIGEADLSLDDAEDVDFLHRLQAEIAYLSKLQRRIVIAYYFENRKQADIAKELDIPLGTVKWHLFEAKKELKRGMDTMRKTSELKFNPIKFSRIGLSGSSGKTGLSDYLHSVLSQNICYCVRESAKTVGNIADDLGVSPVYIESEIETLEEYGLLLKKGDRYIANFIIDIPSKEIMTIENEMYRRASNLFANDLYDELVSSGILSDPDIVCGQTDAPISLTESPRADDNFILWSLIPYIAACSGEELMDKSISFEEVATIRPDGSHNIFYASLEVQQCDIPDDYVYMKNWCGPMWTSYGGKTGHTFWQIKSEWTDSVGGDEYMLDFSDEAHRVLSLYESEEESGILSKNEYAWLAERGYIKTNGDYDGYFKSSWQIVSLASNDIKQKLLDIGKKIKLKYADTFAELKKPFIEASVNAVPEHIRKMVEYQMQFIFNSDGWFLLHCIVALLSNGKLKLPTEGQRKALMTLILPN